MFDFLSKDRIIAGSGFNRWLIAPAALGIHLCIGSVYAWSLFNTALTRRVGVVTSAADDWTLKSVVSVFTVAIVCLGLSAALAGKWLERVGPRVVGFVATCCWAGGFLLGAVGIVTGNLWLLYLGYGVVGGCGLGLGYVSPVSTLISWFPDRRGMATGIAIMGFGGGAMLAKPIIGSLLAFYYRPPDYLGATSAVSLVTREGRRLADIGGQLREVVIVGANDLSGMILPGPEGVYLAGTGSVGIAETFFTLAAVYFVVMMGAAFAYRLPPPGWRPAGWHPPANDGEHLVSTHNVHIDEALKTPQFYQLWIMLCFNVTAGIGVLAVAQTMISEIFGASLPTVVDASFAASFVLMLSLFNMLGRFGWATASDYLGRQRTYWIFFTVGIALYCAIPYIATQASNHPSLLWLGLFYGATLAIFTFYGGGFATIPAYIADLFGTRFVGGIHGRLLTAWSLAGVLGPMAITTLRERAVERAIKDLVAQADPARFAAEFGADVSQLESMMGAKTVTIAKLMEIVPPNVVDPTPGLYNETMYLMASLLFVALLANAFMRPVHPRHHLDARPPIS
jgi:MFS family permease